MVSARVERFFEPALLLALRDGPAHGYELVDHLGSWGDDYVVDSGNLYRMLRESIGSLPGVQSIRTTIVLETMSEGRSAPWREEDVARGAGSPAAGGRGAPPSLLSIVEGRYRNEG